MPSVLNILRRGSIGTRLGFPKNLSSFLKRSFFNHQRSSADVFTDRAQQLTYWLSWWKFSSLPQTVKIEILRIAHTLFLFLLFFAIEKLKIYFIMLFPVKIRFPNLRKLSLLSILCHNSALEAKIVILGRFCFEFYMKNFSEKLHNCTKLVLKIDLPGRILPGSFKSTLISLYFHFNCIFYQTDDNIFRPLRISLHFQRKLRKKKKKLEWKFYF